ncbi:MAG: ATP-binding cassette domain-containing protein [Firmicutes bacterium]|nr:ATP-binding cassette domain-containing protein [Bacillota bacterium]
MLKLVGISKSYTVGTFTQVALNNVDLDFRKTEFVTVLGPSGCGKTTLLNIVGGLDHYDKGDLIISGKSTKDFIDQEWDMYRNNSIGFIFQSHNLIPHLSVLQNVEMGMTLSGVSSSERKQRAIEVLTEVGLEDHIYKRPNQLSGGQSQRVAIARALANNPDVILADEPTGSLDSVTSVQILELIKKIAKDKLVIMVTHNSELAYKYSSRIIKLKDGKVVDDSNPVLESNQEKDALTLKKTSMSFKTAVISSINNIRTKIGRTLLTAFAGSIGIIGIALILSLSNGLDQEISNFEKETLSGYPISITESRFDFEKIRQEGVGDLTPYPDVEFATSYDENRLAAYFTTNIITDDYIAYVNDYVTNVAPEKIAGVKYVKDMNFSLLKYVETDFASGYVSLYSESIVSDETDSPASQFGMISSFFTLLPDGDVLQNNYDVIYGDLPDNTSGNDAYQVVLVVDEYNRIYTSTLLSLGFDVENQTEFYFSDIIGTNFKLFIGEYNILTSDVSSAIDIEISGIVRLQDGSNVNLLFNGLGYTSDLTDYIETTFPDEVGAVNSIYLYPNNFDDKDAVKTYLNAYNDGLENDDPARIEFVDQAATFTSMVKGVIDTISIVLIAFAAISLVVSSIMIGIITYISVLERTKEIGVLRALGARKKDISRVFNTENLLIGLAAGLVGIGVSLLLIIPINLIIENLADMPNIAKLSFSSAFFLILISVTLAFVAGLIPARMASKKDPVIALRTE